jgi:hypothetical protein
MFTSGARSLRLSAVKKLVLVLVLLLGIETWGVVGRYQADRIMYDCVIEAGPLCFLWEENALAKLLPEGAAEKLEDSLDDARDAWEKNVVDKLSSDKSDLEKALEKAGEATEKALDAAKEALEEVEKKTK